VVDEGVEVEEEVVNLIDILLLEECTSYVNLHVTDV